MLENEMILVLLFAMLLGIGIASMVIFVMVANWLHDKRKTKSRLIKLKLITVLARLKLLKPGDLFWDV